MEYLIAGMAGFAVGALCMLFYLAVTGKPTPPTLADRASDSAEIESIRAALAQADREVAQRPRQKAVTSPLPTLNQGSK